MGKTTLDGESLGILAVESLGSCSVVGFSLLFECRLCIAPNIPRDANKCQLRRGDSAVLILFNTELES